MSFTLAVVQLELNGTYERNLAKCLDATREAAGRGAEVVCLPELFGGPYFCQTEDTAHFSRAEPADGPSFAAFSALARSLGVVIVVPFFEKRMPGVYHNSALLIDADGSRAGLYRKMHIPDDPQFYEKYYFTPGDLGFMTVPTAKGLLGPLICWDQWYPEAARLTALGGAEVLLYPTAIGWHPAEKERYGALQHGAWMRSMQGHAVANGVFVAAANRVGLEQYAEGTLGIEFWGGSFIAGPQGELLAQAPHDAEDLLIARIDTALIETVRQNWPFLRDRRIDAYGGITSRALLP
jgi:N-carbamoylputrescine amidase